MTGAFGRVLTAMVTPFDDDGALDLDARARRSPAGSPTTATTGWWSRAPPARRPCSPTTRSSRCGPRSPRRSPIPVIAGTGTNDTAHSVAPHRARRADSAWPACSSSTPYYNRPSQAGPRGPLPGRRRRHRPAGDPLRHPDPHRAARSTPTLLVRLAREVPNIVGVKDAAGEPRRDRRAASPSAPVGFELYSGDDALTLPLLASAPSA